MNELVLTGLLVLIFLLTGVGIFLVLRNQRQEGLNAQKRRTEYETRAKQAVWAGATIVTARHHTSAQEMREKVQVDLRLQVQPPQGEPYQAQTVWHVSTGMLSQLQPGQQISIKIDRDNPERIYPNMQGAEFWARD